MLDRGTTRGRFDSGESVIEGIFRGIGLYLFAVHMLTAKRPFIPAVIFKGRNFLAGRSWCSYS